MATLLSLALGVGLLQGQTSDELHQRFLNEAPQRWQEYQTKIEQFDGTVTIITKVEGKLENHTHIEYKHNSRCRLCLSQALHGETLGGELRAYNSLYSFYLLRKTANHPWRVVSLHLHKDNDVSEVVQEFQSGIILIPLRRAVRAGSLDLVALVQRPTFRVLRISPVKHQGEDLVQIEFDNSHELVIPPKSAKEFDPIQGGSLLLDPNRYWCVRASEIREKYNDVDTKSKIEVEFQDPSAKFPVPKRYVDSRDITRTTGERLLRTYEIEYDLHEPSRLPPDKEFTLSAFGFPEPLGVSWSRPTRWYLWLSLAGVLCLAGGGVFYWLKRRA